MRCKIIKSHHSDIPVGIEGEIIQSHGGGFTVSITKEFARADSPVKRQLETRGIFFAQNEVEILPDEPD